MVSIYTPVRNCFIFFVYSNIRPMFLCDFFCLVGLWNCRVTLKKIGLTSTETLCTISLQCGLKLELSLGNAVVSKFTFLAGVNLMDDLENHRASLRCPLNILCVISLPSLHSSWSYRPGKWKFGQNLFFPCDVELWPSTLNCGSTLTLLIAITIEHIMMIRWQEHRQKTVSNPQIDGDRSGQTDGQVKSVQSPACSQLKYHAITNTGFGKEICCS